MESVGDLLLGGGERQSVRAGGSDRPHAVAEGPHIVLIGRVQEGGDGEAFKRLYQLYAPMVHGILLVRVPHKDVDDLMQDVFLTAFTRINTLRNAAAFGGWLAMIARHRACDFYRRQYEVTEEIPERHTREDGQTEIQAAEILAVIRTLPETYRETLIMRLVEGLTGPEISDLTGLTPASVRVNLSRGLKMLRGKLNSEA